MKRRDTDDHTSRTFQHHRIERLLTTLLDRFQRLHVTVHSARRLLKQRGIHCRRGARRSSVHISESPFMNVEPGEAASCSCKSAHVPNKAIAGGESRT